MITVATRSGQNLAVFGLGASGIATATALAQSGARVTAWDDNAPARKAAEAAGLDLADPRAADWSALDALVLSPGVPLTHPRPHPVVGLAGNAGRPVLGDIELLAEACPDATFIAITGTNGKSTTTALVGHVLEGADRRGRKIQIGGNLGPPALSLAPMGEDGIYVLELSSYQLDLTIEARFDIAVLLNISPDHLDRHGDMAGYVAAKRRIFRDRPSGDQTAVIGVDDDHGRALAAEIARQPSWRVIPISSGTALDDGVYVLEGVLFDAMSGGAATSICDLRGIETLPGAHNWQNAAAAYATARATGLDGPDIATRLATYPGLPHRQESVATIGGVRYVNDSKATNPDATARALACYDAIYWIAGGRAKDGGLKALAPYLDRIRHAFLIGEAAEPFAAELDGRVTLTRSGDLASAVKAAHDVAGGENAVVLLSPACASFDQWPNFMARGDAFRDMVAALARGDGA